MGKRAAKPKKTPRNKRDTMLVIAHEAIASAPDTRARKAKVDATKVRGTPA